MSSALFSKNFISTLGIEWEEILIECTVSQGHANSKLAQFDWSDLGDGKGEEKKKKRDILNSGVV